MNHDIIDDRQEKLVDHINRILSSTESARFAVGYFFLSGLASIASRLADFQKVAARQAVQIVKDYGGAFVADVVGLGKRYIGAACPQNHL